MVWAPMAIRWKYCLMNLKGSNGRFRRNLSIEYPTKLAKQMSAIDKLPILSPEIALLYKAKWDEAKNHHDFQECLPLLGQEQKNWLRQSIPIEHGTHPWLEFPIDSNGTDWPEHYLISKTDRC